MKILEEATFALLPHQLEGLRYIAKSVMHYVEQAYGGETIKGTYYLPKDGENV